MQSQPNLIYPSLDSQGFKKDEFGNDQVHTKNKKCYWNAILKGLTSAPLLLCFLNVINDLSLPLHFSFWNLRLAYYALTSPQPAPFYSTFIQYLLSLYPHIRKYHSLLSISEKFCFTYWSLSFFSFLKLSGSHYIFLFQPFFVSF